MLESDFRLIDDNHVSIYFWMKPVPIAILFTNYFIIFNLPLSNKELSTLAELVNEHLPKDLLRISEDLNAPLHLIVSALQNINISLFEKTI
jgi:hypothetical protein